MIVLSALLGAFLHHRWIANPRTTNPTQVDAVVVLGGGLQERTDRGLDLIARGVSPVLVLSLGIAWAGPEYERVLGICRDGIAGVEVICIRALPDSTKGEAMTTARLARERSWRSIAVVTTDHHVSRATRWFERCFAGAVFPVAARGPSPWAEVRHEWFGTIAQFSIDRSCDR